MKKDMTTESVAQRVETLMPMEFLPRKDWCMCDSNDVRKIITTLITENDKLRESLAADALPVAQRVEALMPPHDKEHTFRWSSESPTRYWNESSIRSTITALVTENDKLRAALATTPSEHHVIAAFLERSGQYVTNDATRDACIAAAITAARAALAADANNGLVEQLRQEAQIHAQEARTANATIAEIYQLCTGATGEPGNWNGAEPVRKHIAELKALAAEAVPVAGTVRFPALPDALPGSDFPVHAPRQMWEYARKFLAANNPTQPTSAGDAQAVDRWAIYHLACHGSAYVDEEDFQSASQAFEGIKKIVLTAPQPATVAADHIPDAAKMVPAPTAPTAQLLPGTLAKERRHDE